MPLWAAKVKRILVVKELDSRRVEMQKNKAGADDSDILWCIADVPSL
jgi:hypothetical protein